MIWVSGLEDALFNLKIVWRSSAASGLSPKEFGVASDTAM